jgi:hypothetical protein
MKVSILAYDGCMGAEVFGFADILLVANRINAFRRPSVPPPFECKIVSGERSCVTLAGAGPTSLRILGVRRRIFSILWRTPARRIAMNLVGAAQPTSAPRHSQA